MICVIIVSQVKLTVPLCRRFIIFFWLWLGLLFAVSPLELLADVLCRLFLQADAVKVLGHNTALSGERVVVKVLRHNTALSGERVVVTVFPELGWS